MRLHKITAIMKKSVIIMAVLALLSCNQEKQNSQGENFSNNVNKVANTIVDDSEQLSFFKNPKQPIQPKFEQFPSGSVQPKGWIFNMMKSDLEQGIVGALGELYPGINSDDLYNTARRGGMEDIPEMGDLVLTGAEWETSIMWWNAETIGNWWDGFIRHAFLTDHKEAIQQSHEIIENLLNSQDEDGYIGIYKPNLRYQHEGSNGELWAQTTAFRTMLAYYEFTQDITVLEAVEKAMKLTIQNYGETGKNPFKLKNEFGGVTHGLMLTDVCETLYRITKNQTYQDYATYLYKAFSTYSINRSFNDLRYPFLKERDSLFEGHGVHTYEHIRSMVNAYYNTGYPQLAKAYNNMLYKLEPCILPSGAGHGNEWILKMKAHPTNTSTEYCTMLELRNSYGALIQKTGDVTFADAAEKLTYSAMLGSRNREGTAITYGKPDNCFVLDGHHHENGESKVDPRYKYSPTHSEPAVCCVPNYSRNFPYLLEQMWMKAENGIAAILFGPSKLTTQMNGYDVSIEQITNYPMSDVVTFRFTMDKPMAFDFQIRQPNWSNGLESNIELGDLKDGFYTVSKEWKNGDVITIKFNNEIKQHKALNDEVYFQRGPIVYAFEIPHKEETIKTYSKANYRDYHCFPSDEEFKYLMLTSDSKFELKSNSNYNSFYDSQWNLEGSLFNTSNNENQNVTLVPIGKTVLRRVTFPNK
jgi:DUF1680 family protein